MIKIYRIMGRGLIKLCPQQIHVRIIVLIMEAVLKSEVVTIASIETYYIYYQLFLFSIQEKHIILNICYHVNIISTNAMAVLGKQYIYLCLQLLREL